MAKLNRDKTQEIKELLIQQEALKEFNDNLTNKLVEEKEKYSKLANEKITIDEKLRLLLLALKDDTEFAAVQKKELDDLNKKIETEEKLVKDLEDKVKEARIVKHKEEEDNRRLNQIHDARTSKKNYLTANYNFSDNVEQMKTEIFDQIVKTNSDVNSQVTDFTKKLDGVQRELKQIKAQNIFAQ